MKIRTFLLKPLNIFFFFAFFGFIVGCDEERCDQSSSAGFPTVDLEVDRLEYQLRDFGSPDDAIQFLSDNRTLADYFLRAEEYPNDTILARRMFGLFKHAAVDTLFQEVDDYFHNWDEIEKEFEAAFGFIKSQYPGFKIPKIQTIVTGFSNDMYISDSLLVIGLDYFMGVQGSYHPNDIPIYIVQRYVRESTAPFVLSFISNDFNHIDRQHNTLLADMINLGKSYYFVSEALPCKPDSLIIGYSAEEIRLVRENQEVIWANLIENELLYESDNNIRNKFIGESPNVVEISEKCPGRIGAWLGWQIVRKYMDENPEVSFNDLMNEKDAHKIFQKSGYKPRNEN